MDEKTKQTDWRETIRGLCLFDDVLMTKCFNDKQTIEYVLRVTLGRKFFVKTIVVQKESEPSSFHGARFDVLAADEKGSLCDIEIQRQDTGSLEKRAGFYSCALGAAALEKGEDYDRLRETFVIFITETDVFKRGAPTYNVERCFMDTKAPFGDGSHIVFVNGAYNGADEAGNFARDMRESDPRKIHSALLADRIKLFKETDKGVKEMSETLEKIKEAGRIEGRAEVRADAARVMLENNLGVEMTAKCAGLPIEQVRALASTVR